MMLGTERPIAYSKEDQYATVSRDDNILGGVFIEIRQRDGRRPRVELCSCNA